MYNTDYVTKKLLRYNGEDNLSIHTHFVDTYNMFPSPFLKNVDTFSVFLSTSAVNIDTVQHKVLAVLTIYLW